MTLEPPFQTAKDLQRSQRGLAALTKGTHARVRAVVRSVEVRKTSRGDNYLTLTLADRTGEVQAKSWDGASLAARLAVGTALEFAKLDVDDYGPKFEPRDLAILVPGSFDPADFVPSLPQEVIEENWSQLHDRLDSMENPHLMRLRDAVFAEPEVEAKYKTWPSAVTHHHNYLGGNVQHVVGIMRVVDALSTGHPELDRDAVLLGAAIHDLGKLREYGVDTTITVTDEGRLRGHLVIGAEWLGRIVGRLRADGYEFPRGLEDHLVHMILSHHRKGEWGSPKPPATPEAMVLHLADYADSQTKGYLQDVEKGQENPDGWAKRWDSDAGQSLWIRTRRGWE